MGSVAWPARPGLGWWVEARRGQDCPCPVGTARFWRGKPVSARHGLVRLVKARCPRQGWSGVGWAGPVWRAEAGRELAGLARQGPAGVARVARHGMTGRGTAWLARWGLVAGFWLRAAWLAWLGEHGRSSQGRGRMGRQVWLPWCGTVRAVCSAKAGCGWRGGVVTAWRGAVVEDGNARRGWQGAGASPWTAWSRGVRQGWRGSVGKDRFV